MGPPASDRVPRARPYSGSCPVSYDFAYGSFTLYALTFQPCSAIVSSSFDSPQPLLQAAGLASFPFARRYLGNRCFFLLLRVLRCFSSPRYLMMCYFTHTPMTDHYISRVPPFGNLRFIGYVLLSAAYRSLSRPSSAPSAKASTVCSSLLGQTSFASSLPYMALMYGLLCQ